MRKTISELAVFLRNLLPPEITGTYAVDPMFAGIAGEAEIREGVLAFREFLHKTYNRLIDGGGEYDTSAKIKHEHSDSVNIARYYPFVNYIKIILTNIGYNGALNENKNAIILDGAQSLTSIKPLSNIKIPVPNKIKCLRFLTGCGLHIGGADLNAPPDGKKNNLFPSGPLIFSYPENSAMLIGLTVMARSQIKFNPRGSKDILLRCDYRALANKKAGEADACAVLGDLVNPLPAAVKEFLLELHSGYVDGGHKCEISIMALYYRFIYYIGSRELWRINVSLNNGFNFSIKATDTDKYAETVEKFPDWLKEKIAMGYGCGKKRGVTASCDGGCRGYRIPLDGPDAGVCKIIRAWIGAETRVAG